MRDTRFNRSAHDREHLGGFETVVSGPTTSIVGNTATEKVIASTTLRDLKEGDTFHVRVAFQYVTGAAAQTQTMTLYLGTASMTTSLGNVGMTPASTGTLSSVFDAYITITSRVSAIAHIVRHSRVADQANANNFSVPTTVTSIPSITSPLLLEVSFKFAATQATEKVDLSMAIIEKI